jgi:hypothetical protein
MTTTTKEAGQPLGQQYKLIRATANPVNVLGSSAFQDYERGILERDRDNNRERRTAGSLGER